MRRKRPARQAPPSPYHLVEDRNGRRTILCAISDCIQRRELGSKDTVGHCQEFIRLRGTLAARWRINRKRKFKRLMDRALEFQEQRRLIAGSSNHTPLEEQVRKTYTLWKRHAKPGILARLRANLKDTLVKEYNLTEQEAIVQGGLDDHIFDSSDEEA
ncbi:hypothetical protein R1sor_022177 [Riccia sorocarpa]|uniref:Uncharacterized protein n=1 Tax=Riccia sorocarpa TaxID=122646 RepID=A0ABD3GKM2_9MARC